MAAPRLVCVASLLVLALPCAARAELPAGTHLSWSAPPACPQAPAFIAEVERFLGQSLAPRRDQQLDVSGLVQTDARAGFSVKLSWRGQHGTQKRQLSHENCQELTEAAALVTALAIDPQLSIAPEPPPTAPAASTAETPPAAASTDDDPPPPALAPVFVPPSAPATPDRRTQLPQPSARPPLSMSATLLGLVGAGELPDAGMGVGGQFSLGGRRFRVAARGVYWLPRFVALEGDSGPGVELDLWSVGFRACALPLHGDWALAACLGPDIGDLRGRGTELENERTQHDRWSALSLELALSHEADSGLLTLVGVGVGKTLEAPRFGIERNGEEVELFQSAGWGALAFVGLGVFR